MRLRSSDPNYFLISFSALSLGGGFVYTALLHVSAFIAYWIPQKEEEEVTAKQMTRRGLNENEKPSRISSVALEIGKKNDSRGNLMLA